MPTLNTVTTVEPPYANNPSSAPLRSMSPLRTDSSMEPTCQHVHDKT